MSSDTPSKPTIMPTTDGPFLVQDLQTLTNRQGALATRPAMALCRCGGSSNKPFCDGTHARNGFSSAKVAGRIEDKREDYVGDEITIHDNRGLCSHAGHCTDCLPEVFHLREEPWIHPNGAGKEEIIATIRKCPSGALSYSVDGIEYRDREGDPAILVSHNGPYIVTGGPELLDTERGEGVSLEHYTLCRCGGSKNKPFCDGSHWYNNFNDEKN